MYMVMSDKIKKSLVANWSSQGTWLKRFLSLLLILVCGAECPSCISLHRFFWRAAFSSLRIMWMPGIIWLFNSRVRSKATQAHKCTYFVFGIGERKNFPKLATQAILRSFIFFRFVVFQLLVFELEKCKTPEVSFTLEPKIKGETVYVE